jgi:hypothetical protein
MILEKVPDIPLLQVWNGLNVVEQLKVIKAIAVPCRDLCKANFPAYGSLYLSDEMPSGAIEVDSTFCIGPLTAAHQWGYAFDQKPDAEALQKYQGPCKNILVPLVLTQLHGDGHTSGHTFEDYLSHQITRARLKAQAQSKGSASRHIELLDVFKQITDSVFTTNKMRGVIAPMLSHPDLHTRNILVDVDDHTKVTGLIDWQFASVEPAYVFVNETPDFAEELPPIENLESLSEERKAARKRHEEHVDLCVKMWAVLGQTVGKTKPAATMPSEILRVLVAPGADWLHDEIGLQSLLEDLIEVCKDSDLQLPPVSVPRQPGDDARLD